MQSRANPQQDQDFNDDFAGLVQRAAVQIGSLRRTLEEAAECDRLVRERAAELGRRMEQGERFNSEMDKRLETATGAVGILEKTNAGLHALEGLLARVREEAQVLEASWVARLDQARGGFEARLNEHIRAVEERLEAHAKRGELMSAALDRRAAAVSARCAVAVDESEERLAHLERRATDLAGPATDELNGLFERAQVLIGSGLTNRRVGALTEAVDAAEQTVTDCKDASIRLGALVSDSAGERQSLAAAVRRAEERTELLDRCMNQATDQAHALVTIVKDVLPVLERAEGKRAGLRAAA